LAVGGWRLAVGGWRLAVGKVGQLCKLSTCQDAWVVDKLKTYPTL
jgi:hypothetical protein